MVSLNIDDIVTQNISQLVRTFPDLFQALCMKA